MKAKIADIDWNEAPRTVAEAVAITRAICDFGRRALRDPTLLTSANLKKIRQANRAATKIFRAHQ